MKKYNFLLFPGFRRKAVTLSYDDGVIYDKKLIEVMSRNGLKGTFNINSGMFAKEPGGRRMTKEESFRLYSDSGNEVAVHGEYHYSLSEVDTAMATGDVLQDRISLEKMFGKVVKGMAYANGSYDDEVVNILKSCGIEYARTTVCTENFHLPTDWLRMPATCHHKNPKLMELAREFLEKEEYIRFWVNTPSLFYLYGHSYEFNDDDNWEIIEEFAEYVGNREDVWYATNGEIYDYVKAFDALKLSADGKMAYNPTCKTIYYNYFNKKYEIHPNETVLFE